MRIALITFVAIIALILVSATLGGSRTQLIDVRTPEEYAISHAKDAINIPLATIQSGDFSKMKKNASIKLYCRTGKRATEAKSILEKAGFKKVVNIGGLAQWKEKGGAVCESTKPNC